MSTDRGRVVREGLLAGFLGYMAVVILFVILNVAGGESLFHTPRVLGTALLEGVLDPGDDFAPVLAYNGLHLLVSLGLGMACAFLAERAETDHNLGYGLVFAVLALGGWVPIFFGAVAVEYLHALSWLHVLAGSAVGAAATLGYIAWAHSRLVVELFSEADT